MDNATETRTLVESARSGDRAAFERLVERYQGLTRAYAASLLGDETRAEDAAQDAFLAAYQNLKALRDPAAFPGWLRGIVFRCCARVWRARRPGSLSRAAEPSVAASQHAAAEPSVAASQHAAVEATAELADALAALPPPLAEAVLLFHREGYSQRELAQFLGVPESTVVNRLHKARGLLKERQGIMGHNAEGKSFAARVADVLSVHDGLLEARMAGPDRPQVFDVLAAGGKDQDPRFVVIQRKGDGKLVCLEAGDPGDGGGGERAAARKLTWSGSEGSGSAGFTDAAIMAAVAHLRGPHRGEARFLETGVKVLDLFCPLRSEGVTGLFGTHGVGRLVVAQELTRNLAAHGQNLLFFVSNWDVPGTQALLDESSELDGSGRVKTAWLISRQATNPHYGLDAGYIDTRIYCSPALAARGLWPAVDPLYCASTAASLVETDHQAVAAQALATMRTARALLQDAEFFELLALGAPAAAKARHEVVVTTALATLTGEDRTAVVRAQRLEWFLTQPFLTMAESTGKPGVYVPLASTLDGCRRILAGECDAASAKDLLYRGTLD